MDAKLHLFRVATCAFPTIVLFGGRQALTKPQMVVDGS